jgi:hypothetical protein
VRQYGNTESIRYLEKNAEGNAKGEKALGFLYLQSKLRA